MIICFGIKRFRIWLPLPLYVLKELLWQIIELMDVIGAFGNKKLREIKKTMPAVIFALDNVSGSGKYDLLDIQVSGDEKVSIIIKVR